MSKNRLKTNKIEWIRVTRKSESFHKFGAIKDKPIFPCCVDVYSKSEYPPEQRTVPTIKTQDRLDTALIKIKEAASLKNLKRGGVAILAIVATIHKRLNLGELERLPEFIKILRLLVWE